LKSFRNQATPVKSDGASGFPLAPFLFSGRCAPVPAGKSEPGIVNAKGSCVQNAGFVILDKSTGPERVLALLSPGQHVKSD
jgi:hypothetical protein